MKSNVYKKLVSRHGESFFKLFNHYASQCDVGTYYLHSVRTKNCVVNIKTAVFDKNLEVYSSDLKTFENLLFKLNTDVVNFLWNHRVAVVRFLTE